MANSGDLEGPPERFLRHWMKMELIRSFQPLTIVGSQWPAPVPLGYHEPLPFAPSARSTAQEPTLKDETWLLKLQVLRFCQYRGHRSRVRARRNPRRRTTEAERSTSS